MIAMSTVMRDVRDQITRAVNQISHTAQFVKNGADANTLYINFKAVDQHIFDARQMILEKKACGDFEQEIRMLVQQRNDLALLIKIRNNDQTYYKELLGI